MYESVAKLPCGEVTVAKLPCGEVTGNHAIYDTSNCFNHSDIDSLAVVVVSFISTPSTQY